MFAFDAVLPLVDIACAKIIKLYLQFHLVLLRSICVQLVMTRLVSI